jgi:hypothetical protein
VCEARGAKQGCVVRDLFSIYQSGCVRTGLVTVGLRGIPAVSHACERPFVSVGYWSQSRTHKGRLSSSRVSRAVSVPFLRPPVLEDSFSRGFSPARERSTLSIGFCPLRSEVFPSRQDRCLYQQQQRLPALFPCLPTGGVFTEGYQRPPALFPCPSRRGFYREVCKTIYPLFSPACPQEGFLPRGTNSNPLFSPTSQ